MNKTKNLGLSASANGINFYIICDNEKVERPYGILSSSETNKDDSFATENIFFTKEEAAACCLWLAANDVSPITLCEVLANFYPVKLNC